MIPDAMERAKYKGHAMGPLTIDEDPAWIGQQSTCTKCGLKLYEYGETGVIYGAAALLTCEEMQKINKTTEARQKAGLNTYDGN